MAGVDADLIRRARAGEEGAFLELYDRYAPDVYAYLRLILADPLGAELATQDVFTEALDALPNYERDSFPARIWLLWLAHECAGPSRRPRNTTVNWDNGAKLGAVISRLGQGPREAFVLRHLIGLTVSEASLVLGRTPNAICALERRAFCSLEKILAPPVKQRQPLQPQRLGLRMRSRESPVAYRRRWALALR